MFSGQLQPYLEPRKLADQGAEIHVETRVSELPRLAEFRDSQDHPVKVALKFDRQDDGERTISGDIETSLVMSCQRCLEPVEVGVHARVALTLVWTEEQAKALTEGQDPCLLHDEKLPFAELLEEEILLALPAVAMHEQCPTPLATEAGDEQADAREQDNPFAVLAKLKGRQED